MIPEARVKLPLTDDGVLDKGHHESASTQANKRTM